MARSVQAGIHGRTRRRIVAMGGLFGERFHSPGRNSLIVQDKFLAVLLRNGAITEEQIQQAIESYRRCPEDFAWLLRHRHTTLDKADKIFFVRHDRFPTENADFFLKGDYHDICQTLHYDPDCFDEELKQLGWDIAGNPRVVTAPPEVIETVRRENSKKGNTLAFALVLLVTLASAMALPVLITVVPTVDVLSPLFVVAIGWAICLACGLIVTRPRQSLTSTVCHSCSECGGQFDAATPVNYCPQCGIRFEAGAGTSVSS